MKLNILMVCLLSSVFVTSVTQARTVEVDVHGMTCAFCVDSLERKFGEMKAISKVEVSLKMKKIRLETNDDLPTLETIKQTVLDTGFMPIHVEVIDDAKE